MMLELLLTLLHLFCLPPALWSVEFNFPLSVVGWRPHLEGIKALLAGLCALPPLPAPAALVKAIDSFRPLSTLAR